MRLIHTVHSLIHDNVLLMQRAPSNDNHTGENYKTSWERLDENDVDPWKLMAWQSTTGKLVPSDLEIEAFDLRYSPEELERLERIKEQLITIGRA